MKHTAKLIEKINELKAQGMAYNEIADAICAYHKHLFLRVDAKARHQFNEENGLSSFARPEKSYWRVYEILDSIIEEQYN